MPRVSFVLVALLAAALLVSTSGTAGRSVQGTLVGDSVAGSISQSPDAQAELKRGLSVRLDAEVCRRLVRPSCLFRGASPTTAFQAVRSYGRGLGEILIVHVGYNDSADGYPQGIDRVLRAARSQGVESVIWVTLHEATSAYRRTNVAIASAAERWPELALADWSAHSRDELWFRRDGIHLNGAGARALASFLRARVLDVARRSS